MKLNTGAVEGWNETQSGSKDTCISALSLLLTSDATSHIAIESHFNSG